MNAINPYLERDREYRRKMYASEPSPIVTKPKPISIEEQLRQLKDELMQEYRQKQNKEFNEMYERMTKEEDERRLREELEELKESIIKVVKKFLELDGQGQAHIL